VLEKIRSKTMKKLLTVIMLILILFACTKPDGSYSQNRPDRDFDEYERLILDIFLEKHELKHEPFITYEIMDIEEDNLYKRVYIMALIDDIDKNYKIVSSFYYPFAFVFDNEKDELIRYFYPADSKDPQDIINNFSEKAWKNHIRVSTTAEIQRMDAFRSTNLWNAETYYEHSEE
jgi:hypothetical protein